MNFTANKYTPSREVTRKKGCASSPMNKIQSNGLSKKTNNKPIIYPQLQEASMYTVDKFWIDVMLKAARGEFFSKHILYDGVYIYKRDIGIRELMPEDPEDLCKAFVLFHKKHEKAYSCADNDKQKKIRKNRFNQNVDLDWALCNKEMKQSRLTEYCHRKTKTKEDAVELIAILRSAMDMNLLNQYTVSMENNIITNITSIKYSKRTQKWYIPS